VHEIAADLAVCIERSTRGIDHVQQARLQLRALRKSLIPTLQMVENLTAAERRVCREDFETFLHLALTLELTMGEPDIPENKEIPA